MKNRAKQTVTNVKSVQGRQITGFFPRARTSSDSDAHLISSNTHSSMHSGSDPQSVRNGDLRPSIAITDQNVTMGDSTMFQRSASQGNGVLDAGIGSGLDMEDQVDLEAPITNTGLIWADEEGEMSDVTDDGIRKKGQMDWNYVNAGKPSWARVVQGLGDGPGDSIYMPSFKGESVNHKAEVPPIFLTYKRVSTDGECILLIQVAASVAQAMHDNSVLDAIQPMRAGWCIYMRSIADRAKLVAQGITVAGRHIQLQSDVRHDKQRSVKVTLHDLPLHSVDNTYVLDALREVCHVTSPVYGKCVAQWPVDQY